MHKNDEGEEWVPLNNDGTESGMSGKKKSERVDAARNGGDLSEAFKKIGVDVILDSIDDKIVEEKHYEVNHEQEVLEEPESLGDDPNCKDTEEGPDEGLVSDGIVEPEPKVDNIESTNDVIPDEIIANKCNENNDRLESPDEGLVSDGIVEQEPKVEDIESKNDVVPDEIIVNKCNENNANLESPDEGLVSDGIVEQEPKVENIESMNDVVPDEIIANKCNENNVNLEYEEVLKNMNMLWNKKRLSIFVEHPKHDTSLPQYSSCKDTSLTDEDIQNIPRRLASILGADYEVKTKTIHHVISAMRKILHVHPWNPDDIDENVVQMLLVVLMCAQQKITRLFELSFFEAIAEDIGTSKWINNENIGYGKTFIMQENNLKVGLYRWNPGCIGEIHDNGSDSVVICAAVGSKSCLLNEVYQKAPTPDNPANLVEEYDEIIDGSAATTVALLRPHHAHAIQNLNEDVCSYTIHIYVPSYGSRLVWDQGDDESVRVRWATMYEG